MDNEKWMELVRLQGRLIALLQTEIAATSVFAFTNGYVTPKERSDEAKQLREKIKLLKEGNI
jgi:hypothetical protein